MEYRLRVGTADDLDAMYALDVQCFDEVFRFSRAAMRRFSEGPNRRMYVAETAAGEMAGFCIISVHAKFGLAYVVTLDVAPAHRRVGVAGLLMQAAEEHAAAVPVVEVELHVFAGNGAARALYRGRGYEEVGVEEEFYGAGLDAVVMRKEPGSDGR